MSAPELPGRRSLCGALLGALVLPLGMRPAIALDAGLVAVDREVPEFSLNDLDGYAWQAARLTGKPWIINFWATWCPPCIEEMPSMNAAWQRIAAEGIGMLAVNAGEGAAAVKTFLATVPIEFPVLLGDGASTLPAWSVRALPTTLIVDTQRRIVYEALGPRDWRQADLLDPVRALRASD